MHRPARHPSFQACLFSMIVVLSGCGPPEDTIVGPNLLLPSKDPALAAQVPKVVREKGKLNIATGAIFPPIEFVASDGQTIIGVDPDIARAMTALLGLKANLINTPFDAIIPGLASGKYDLAFASMTDTSKREKVVDFVTYLSAGTSLYTKTSNAAPPKELGDLCGRRVSVAKATTQQLDAEAQSAKCMAAGKPPVRVLVFPDQIGSKLSVLSGRTEAGMMDAPAAAYMTSKSDGQLKVVGESYGGAVLGIAIAKNNGMARPVLGAIKALISSGRYMEILKGWGVQKSAIKEPAINPAGQR